jgi:tetratricopeptide (TPR) repeat protein
MIQILNVCSPTILVSSETYTFSPGRGYAAIGHYYMAHNHDIPTAIKFCERSLSVSGNVKLQSHTLYYLAWCKWRLGDYSAAQRHAYEAQRLARISADLYMEAQALHIDAMCSTALGTYKKSISLCNRARDLLALCGISGDVLDRTIMNAQAEVHRCKSEYMEGHNIYTRILQEAPPNKDQLRRAWDLLNISEIGVSSGLTDDIQRNIDIAKSIFTAIEDLRGVQYCDIVQADLNLREGKMLVAKALFEEGLRVSRGKHTDIVSLCLENLGNVSSWGAIDLMPTWTTVFLAHSLKVKQNLETHKALQFLGDVFLTQGDESTAINLFTVALDGFTYMDVHSSRAECMLRLGDISKMRSDLFKAVGLWEKARPLFERSLQRNKFNRLMKGWVVSAKICWRKTGAT